ncbi:MAG: STAS domain-containing protein [Alphaproteobacteria bacterium]|nr:STAS domain-containing protein [Alphaproteobacteria bacterium]
MKLGEEKRGTVLILTVEGRLDADTAGDVQGRIEALIDGGENALLLDLTKLDYISSAGLRVLLIAAKRLNGNNGRFAICGLSDNVAEVFAVSGFDTIIDIHPDMQSAHSALTG